MENFEPVLFNGKPFKADNHTAVNTAGDACALQDKPKTSKKFG